MVTLTRRVQVQKRKLAKEIYATVMMENTSCLLCGSTLRCKCFKYTYTMVHQL